MAFPGTPVGHLFNRGMNPQPRPPGLRQVMSPRPNLFPAPASLRASFRIVDENILLSRDAEELSAQRVILEAQMVIEESQREEQLSQELREIHFAHAVSAQTQQELLHWEQQERAAYETRFSIARHQLAQEAAQHHYQREIESVQYFHRLKAEMMEAETSYRTSVQQEAETFAQQLCEEVAFQANSTAQAQSLLSAERQQYDKNLKEQTETSAGLARHGCRGCHRRTAGVQGRDPGAYSRAT